MGHVLFIPQSPFMCKRFLVLDAPQCIDDHLPNMHRDKGRIVSIVGDLLDLGQHLPRKDKFISDPNVGFVNFQTPLQRLNPLPIEMILLDPESHEPIEEHVILII